MKSLLINTIIAIVSFTLGYVFCPTANNSKIETSLTSEISSEVNIQDDECFDKSAETKTALVNTNNLTESTNFNLQNVKTNPPYEDQSVNQITEEETSNKITEEIIDESVIAAKKDLKEWALIHKDRISELITAHASSSTAKYMNLSVLENNDFLSEPPIQQEPIEDADWAYTMEQELNMLISQHDLSEEIELLNISCKQLMCDILVLEKYPRAWFNIYISLTINAPKVDNADDNSTKFLTYIDGDKSVIYTQIKFKSS